MQIDQTAELPTASGPACARMNRIIVACRDDAHALGRAAGVVIDPDGRRRLLDQARSRRGFVEALSAEVRALGGEPAEYGSILATVGTMFGLLRTAVAGTHEGDAYADCMRAGRRVEKAYARASGNRLPERQRAVVATQAREVTESCDELTKLRGMH